MKALLFILSLLFLGLPHAEAQVRKDLLGGFGVNYIFGTHAPDNIGYSGYLGFGLGIGEKNSIRFLPQLQGTFQRYRSSVELQSFLNIEQFAVEILLQAGLPLNNRTLLKPGFFTSFLVHDQVSFSYVTSTITFHTQREEYNNHEINPVQVGLNLGLAFFLNKAKSVALDIRYKQYLVSSFGQDYQWTTTSRGAQIIAFNKTSLPSSLLIGAIISLK